MTDCYNLDLNMGDEVWINKPTVILEGCPFTDQWSARVTEQRTTASGEDVIVFETSTGKRFKYNQSQIDRNRVTKKISRDECPEMFY